MRSLAEKQRCRACGQYRHYKKLWRAKRILINWKKPGAVEIPGRSFLAYPFAPIFAVATPGAGGAPLVIIAMIGIMAAIAIPQFETYKAKAKIAALENELSGTLHTFNGLAAEYEQNNNSWPCTPEELNSPENLKKVEENGWELRVNCQDQFLALIYPHGSEHKYKLVYFDSGKMEDGVL